MRRIVADFERAAAGLPRRFRGDLATAIAKCRKDCDSEAFVRELMDRATLTEQKLADAQDVALAQLQRRGEALGGFDGVLGGAGDLTRAAVLIETISLRASSQVTESLAMLKDTPVGGKRLSPTLLLIVRELAHATPVGFLVILTVHPQGGPTGFAHIDGSAPVGANVTVTLTCGGVAQTRQVVTNDLGRWGVSFTVPLSGPTTCTATATAIGSSASMEIHFL